VPLNDEPSGAKSIRLSAGLLLWLLAAGSLTLAAAPDAADARIARGRSLFLREWVPGERSGPGGDGLGPVYNETSCVACHNQGGVGGGGSVSRNVDLIAASETTDIDGGKGQSGRDEATGPDEDALIALHAGFRRSSSVIVHRFGTDQGYEPWRLFVLDPRRGVLAQGRSGRSVVQLHQLPGNREVAEQSLLAKLGMHRTPSPNPAEYGDFTLFHFQRNPIALFGGGLIDAVPDSVLEQAARQRDSRFPEISGRVCRLTDGRIGRFGWKAQEATLEEFVLTACAVELGLEVPGRPQAGNPRDGAYRAPGLDLDLEQCQDLVAFVRSLPAPAEHPSARDGEAEAILSGPATFARIGCGACHVPKLGGVKGIYSDLLLHDLGDDLGEIGGYGVTLPDPAAAVPASDDTPSGGEPTGVAARREWRTAPLCGLRDSGPYLHDGRAETLEQAIALHGGEAEATADRYFRLSPRERWQVQAFLKSLEVPSGDPPSRGGSDRGGE
jgi:mono/diheme cytochrome c family protein